MVISNSPIEPQEYLEGRGAHVVIAEDNAVTRRMIELAVTQLGWTFDSASDGLEAFSLVEWKALSISLVLADLGMPKMTGIQLGKALKTYHDWPRCLWS